MVELKSRADGAYDQGFAGDAFNVAAYLKRTAPNLEVQFLTATGSDTLSMAMREAWRAEGISDILAFTTPAAIPGLYIINLDRNGERTFTYWRSNSAAKRWFSALVANNSVAALQSAHLIYLSGISLAILSDEERVVAALGDLLVDVPDPTDANTDEIALAHEIEEGFRGRTLSDTLVEERREGT